MQPQHNQGSTAGQWQETPNDGFSQVPAPCDCSVPVTTLQAWALALSQGDNSPRREIERLLTDAGYDIRD